MSIALKVSEAHLDHVLDILFLARFHQDHLVIYGEGDLDKYADSNSIARRSDLDRDLYYDGKFSPDMVTLQRGGRVFVVEAKITRLTRKTSNDIVVQTLIYSNHLLSPRIGDKSYKRYEFLERLWLAHRSVSVQRYYGEHISLAEAYKRYFGVTRAPGENKITGRAPDVLFLAPSAAMKDLVEACKVVRGSESFEEFKRFMADRVTHGLKIFRRINELRANWSLLRSTCFHIAKVDESALANVLTEISPLCG